MVQLGGIGYLTNPKTQPKIDRLDLAQSRRATLEKWTMKAGMMTMLREVGIFSC